MPQEWPKTNEKIEDFLKNFSNVLSMLLFKNVSHSSGC